MASSHSTLWTSDELKVFAFLKELIETRQIRTSTEAEILIRRTFDWVTHQNSYRLAMAYGRYRNKIDPLLSELAVESRHGSSDGRPLGTTTS